VADASGVTGGRGLISVYIEIQGRFSTEIPVGVSLGKQPQRAQQGQQEGKAGICPPHRELGHTYLIDYQN